MSPDGIYGKMSAEKNTHSHPMIRYRMTCTTFSFSQKSIVTVIPAATMSHMVRSSM